MSTKKKENKLLYHPDDYPNGVLFNRAYADKIMEEGTRGFSWTKFKDADTNRSNKGEPGESTEASNDK